MLRLGLRTKFFLYSNTLIVVTMTLVAVLGVSHERQVRYEAIERRGRSIAEALAIPITDALLYEDMGLVTETGLIENYIEEILARNQDLLRYVIVTDPSGVVTHSNRWEMLGEPFARAPGPTTIGRLAEAQLIVGSTGERVLEVRMPLAISTKYWGGLAVGYSLAPIERQVEAIAKQAAIVALVLMLGNSILTALYVETLIRPILHLYQTMRRAARGDLTVRAAFQRGDEVGGLAREFNRMMDDLEEAQAREKVQQAQLAHTEKMAAVGTLAAGVAHEVNNPLAGILNCIENMRSDPDDLEMRDRYLDLIHDGLKRIEHTIANLLDFSRPRLMRPEPTSVNHNLRHVLELVAFQVNRAGVEVDLALDPLEPLVMADHFQMEQLFLNLVLNALQAMPDGGVLALRTRQVGNEVEVEVGDTGGGIPEEIKDRIFDPFFTTREVGEGTGLGLTVSDSIVRAHGGSIVASDRDGGGTVFKVTLQGAGGQVEGGAS